MFLFLFFSYNVLQKEDKIRCLSLIDFHCQAHWQPEIVTFDEFLSIFSCLPNLENFVCTFMSEIIKDKLLNSDFIQISKWTQFVKELSHLIHLDCSIICPFKSSTCFETDFIRILANISRHSDRSIDIHIYENNDLINTTKNDVNTFFLIIFI